ncbi:hypothetical protein BG011_000190 [Mortierella polycephala]|uniref:Uncharacterized protein n=1 Tax=Mortierella polycephala TaxID=41804 RepID=A0A9P6PLK6_9FUNG|nr:hypothetical protein BG011_000190 [Mortierella polycephala]
MRFSSSLVGATAIALMISSAQAQETPAPEVPFPDTVAILFYNDNNVETANEVASFNTCIASEKAFAKYSFLNFAPNNATINFYTDSNCQNFTFGLDGYYGGYPGPARSFKWVGWSEDSLGELFNKAEIQGPGAGGHGTTPPPPGGKNPSEGTDETLPPGPDNADKDQNGGNNNDDGSKSSSSSSTFFGGVFGSMLVLGAGGFVFWKTAGKKMVQDKGKGVLPYNRVGRDGDILLTNNSRSHNSFEIGDEDDEDEVDNRRQPRSGRQERYQDDDNA